MGRRPNRPVLASPGMETPTPRELPVVVRLVHAAVCGCGERVAGGERAGYLSTHEGVVCLGCMADYQAGRLLLGDLLARTASLVPPVTEYDVERQRAAAAHRHRVSASANELLHRFLAIRALGTLRSEPQPLEAFTAEPA